MTDPLISVIIPFYNAQGTLETAVKSVLAQTKPHFELLLLDDGSDDRSPETADRLASADPRIRAKHLRRGGVSAARNAGLDIARGAYITFLDADDALDGTFLAVTQSMLEKSGADIASTGFRKVTDRAKMEAAIDDYDGTAASDAGARSAGDEAGDSMVSVLTGEAFLRDRFLYADTRLWSRLYRRELIGDHRFEAGLTIGEDTLFILSLLEKNTKLAVTDKPLYRYYINPAGAMEKPYTASYLDQIRCWEQADEWFRENMPALCLEPAFAARLAAVREIAILLTAGKMSRMSRKERKARKEELSPVLREMKEKLDTLSRVPGVTQALDPGYPAKVRLFRMSPSLYLTLYGKLRRYG